MRTVTLNDEIKIGYPDGFHVMDSEELKNVRLVVVGPVVCLKDPDRHVIITAGCKEINGFSAFILKQKDIAKKMEVDIRFAQKMYGYKRTGSFQREIGGDLADGFGYTYKAQGIDMYGESFAVKKAKKIFYYHFYVRQEFREKNIRVWEEILASVTDCLD